MAWYTGADGVRKVTRIVNVHYDDPLAPYYTIEVDGQERSTERSKLAPMGGERRAQWPPPASSHASSPQAQPAQTPPATAAVPPPQLTSAESLASLRLPESSDDEDVNYAD